MHTHATTGIARPASRYVVRTVDEDWIDLFDPPSRIDAKRPAWEEAQRRVRAHPECTTVVLDRRTGAMLWQSDPDIPRRYLVSAVSDTVFYALDMDLPTVGEVLSAHKKKYDAWTAFYKAVEQPSDDIVVLLDTGTQSEPTVIASSDEDVYRADDA
ncbi:MAG: hypothetical protein F4Y72_06470 [Gammaproteobacteria bacterium]|nr:hypothetical protein [Gammaproteobacteria bacterium]